MATATSAPIRKYKTLGDMLLRAFGNEKSQAWLAEKTFVSQVAVHLWLAGRCRPKPHRLSHVAALLSQDPYELASLAGYDEDPDAMDKVLTAYGYFRDRSPVDRLVFCNKALSLFENFLEDEELKQAFKKKRPELLSELLNAVE